MVDDRPENLLALEALLDDADMRLVKAESGNEALRRVLRDDFALVLLDVQMPDMDGFETAELLRINPKTRHVPIIFVTAGMKDRPLQFKGYELGAVDYLIKPFEPAILKGKVRVFCELYRQRKALEDYGQRMESLVEARTRKLLASEALLQEVGHIANVGGWEIDLASGNLTWTEQVSQIYQVAPGYLPTVDNTSEFYLLESRKALEAALQATIGQGLSFDLELQLNTARGNQRWVHVIGHARHEGGKPNKISGIVQDITERKHAEAHLQLAASVFKHAREGIVITDTRAVILESNETFADITGYSGEEVVGQNISILKSGRQPPEFYIAMWQALVDKGHWYGEIWNRRKDGTEYAENLTISAVRDAAGRTVNYIALFTDITPMKVQQQQLEHIAHYDALTNLPNRVLLADRLQQAIIQSQRRNKSLAVAYLDLDGFKSVNDQHGHEIGDELLVAVSGAMKTALREGDTLARIGGDEFVAVLVDLDSPRDCEPVLARLLHAAADSVKIGEAELQVSASIGVTLYPQDGADADQLMRHADQAMYQAKQSGKNRYHLFDVAEDMAVKTQRENLEQIRHAFGRREFVLYYQPKVNMKTGEVVGAEALIRWQHPERGLLPPGAFLPVIEDHPLSVEVGEWVIDTALVQIAAWQSAGLKIPVSVNVGARQLQQGDFVQRLSALLAAHPGVAPRSLELEVLETSALQDITHVSQVMRACREIGVRFALDDFGTGYSSLTYLKRLPVEMLKIDQSFVRDMLNDPDDLSIIEGIVGLAAAFNRKVIAEGVETVAYGELLLPLGCELAQGYGIARPMPAADFAGWLESWQPDAAWSGWHGRSLNKDELAVAFIEVEHRYWLRTVEAFLGGDRDSLSPLDAHDCYFGRWKRAGGHERYAGKPGLALVVTLHERMHGLARDLVDMQVLGQGPEARARMGELYALRDELIAGMRELVRGGE